MTKQLVIYMSFDIFTTYSFLTASTAQGAVDERVWTSLECLVSWWGGVEVVVQFPQLTRPLTASALVRAVDSKVVQ